LAAPALAAPLREHVRYGKHVRYETCERVRYGKHIRYETRGEYSVLSSRRRCGPPGSGGDVRALSSLWIVEKATGGYPGPTYQRADVAAVTLPGSVRGQRVCPAFQ